MLQQPVFIKYRREFLNKATGYTLQYLSRLATGKMPVTRSFIERVCYALSLPESELFLPDVEAHSTPNHS